MSCILYNLASYDALAKSQLFCRVWRDILMSYYDSPELAAEAFYNLNVRAYCDRYEGRYEEEREGAAVSPQLDSVFEDYIKAEKTGVRELALSALWTLFSRIEYQCCDAHDHNDIPDYWRVLWVKDWAGREMVNHIEEQHAAIAA
ncbi:MAG TPA: hypothetical protein VHU19_14070 [Pyrinomonadaceae bacterium]|jgi:hypothetical protein|nr:hypothetical protein [Pyrinomonadaceae bacterium]